MSKFSEAQRLERRKEVPYLVAGLAICLITLVSWPIPLATVLLAMTAGTLLGRVRMRLFTTNLWIRRCYGALPYLCALGVPINFDGSFAPHFWALGISVTLLIHFMRRKALTIAFNSNVLAVMKREIPGRRYTESAYFLLPGLMQELLFRGVLLTALMPLQLPQFALIAASAILFVLDHLFTGNEHVRPSATNLVTWFGTGLVWATVVVLGGSIWIAIVSHMLLNLPAAILPHLRGRRRLAPASVQSPR